MSEIWRDAVLGMLVSSVPYYQPKPGAPTHFVIVRPLTTDWTMEASSLEDIESKEETVGLIPLSGAYQWRGTCSCGEALELGFEFQGAYHPDWDAILAQKIEAHKHHKAASG